MTSLCWRKSWGAGLATAANGEVCRAIDAGGDWRGKPQPALINYPDEILLPSIGSGTDWPMLPDGVNARWVALGLLEVMSIWPPAPTRRNAVVGLGKRGECFCPLTDRLTQIYRPRVICRTGSSLPFINRRGNHQSGLPDGTGADREGSALDDILTSRWLGFPVMLLLLACLWLTVTGANYPSALLANGLF